MGSLADDQFIADFVAECREHLNAIEPDLLAMEQLGSGCSQEVINKVFRAIHSIKGGAGFFAFEALKTLSHVMESVLMLVRDKTLAVSPALMDPLFSSLDCLRAMLDDIHASDQVPFAKPLAGLKAILDGVGPAGGKVEARLPGQGGRRFSLDSDAVRSVLKRQMSLYHAKAYLHKDVDARWQSPLAFLAGALSVGQCLEAYLDLSDIGGLEDEAEADLSVTLLFASVLEADLLPLALKLPPSQVEALDMPAIREALGMKVAPPRNPQPAPPEASQPAPGEEAAVETVQSRVARDTGGDTLRVRVSLLTKLMKLAGELVLGRNQLMRTMGPHAQSYPGLPDILQNINQVTTELQEAAMQTRMQPVGTIFSRFPRMVRDLSRQMNKQIDVEIHGAEVELDKGIVEMLADPLTHLIRNSVDHGLEDVQERARAGKQPTGRIQLRAYHEGGQVNIVIEDDGAGINAGKVAQKAVAKGLITLAQAAALSDQEKVNLVFAPGFSTAEQVSELSGRGVGMDVVRTNVEKLGGTVELTSAPGQGTTVRLQLPLTLAILPSMIIGVQGQRFAIPQVDVVELVWVRAEEVKSRVERVQGAEVLRLRDKLLPLLRLADVLAIPRAFALPDLPAPSPDRRVTLAARAPTAGRTGGATTTWSCSSWGPTSSASSWTSSMTSRRSSSSPSRSTLKAWSAFPARRSWATGG